MSDKTTDELIAEVREVLYDSHLPHKGAYEALAELTRRAEQFEIARKELSECRSRAFHRWQSG